MHRVNAVTSARGHLQILASAVLWLLATTGVCGQSGSEQNSIAQPGSGAVDFETEILPLLETRCYRCHSERNQESGLRVDNHADFLAGGESGQDLLVPGDASSSFLVRVLRGTAENWPRMPPLGGPLSEDELVTIERWVDQGANWPDPRTAEKRHWAYVAPEWPTVVTAAAPARGHPIDLLVGVRLKAEGLGFSLPADPARLLRRTTLDLIGLPPTPDAVDAFLEDPSPGAFERAVDRLLASPAYGERWAVPWLDLARYADSNGYEKDAAREIWPWRDWVIDALNADMPYDQFVVEQLAGDLLAGASKSQITATGFLRNSMLSEEGGIDPEQYHYEAIVDRLATTSTVFLGSTIQCAQCHDHKYDPFSQKEFYSLLAVFNSQAGDHRTVNSYTYLNGGPVLYLPDAKQQRRLDRLQAAIETVDELRSAADSERQDARARLVEAFLDAPSDITTTMVVRELPEPRATHVHRGGNFRNPGERVEPALPAVLPALPEGSGTLDRLALARWIVSPENPLTARVAVNRMWEQFFGVGLVKTTEDFGTQGERPSNPELLDWLALRFQLDGWSMKSLHKRIVMSKTYQQSSRVSPELYERDPENRWLARGPRFRLTAESIRDQALFASGLLSEQVGGPSVFPFQPEGIWNMPYSSSRWQQSEGDGRFRRGIYTWWQRSATYPAFVNFDAPSREKTCARRDRTNTPLQALTTLNDPAFIEAALGLAVRVLEDGSSVADSDERRLTLAFRLLLSRSPEEAELRRLAELLEQQRARYSGQPAAARALIRSGLPNRELPELEESEIAAWTLVANVLLNLDETITKG